LFTSFVINPHNDPNFLLKVSHNGIRTVMTEIFGTISHLRLKTHILETGSVIFREYANEGNLLKWEILRAVLNLCL
jgi:hypothetical protein